MIVRIILFLIFIFVFSACNGQNSSAHLIADTIQIHRFDKTLFQLIQSEDTLLRQQLLQEYPEMLEITGKAILNIQSPDQPGFFDKLENYYSEPTLKGLYTHAIELYDSIEDLEQELGNGFAYLSQSFPSIPIPTVYMHVSGLNQNVLAGEHLLSLSIDKYMGKEYPLYQDFFYENQRQKMQKSYIVPDYLSGWLMAEFPFEGNESILLDRMVYEGKIKYLIAHALPDIKPYELMGYTRQEYEWCEENSKMIWKSILERKHLYTPDVMTTTKYFEEVPSANTIFPEAPGNLGSWIGWQIIEHYIKEKGDSPEELMKIENAQEILIISKYKGNI